jgi:hypothetical protein
MHGKVGFMLPAIIAASFSLPRLVCAQETAYGHITLLQTVDEAPHVAPGNLGATASAKVLAEDSIAVTLDVPFVNSNELSAGAARSPSSACKVTTGGYALDPTDPGIKRAFCSASPASRDRPNCPCAAASQQYAVGWFG